MGQTTTQTRENRTITVDFHDEATYFALLCNPKAFVEFVLAFILSLGFQLNHKASCRGGGCLTRHSHYARVRLGGLTIWRMQCTSCKAVFTVLPHFVLRYRRMSPEVARHALIATHGGLSLAWCATIYHISPRARLGHCLRHALNKLPRKLIGLSAPIRQDLRSQFHALLHRCRQRKSLRVVALGQRLRHFADHITTTGGEAHGERVRNWFRDKKAGWYAVLEDPRMPASSTLLDQAHNAIDRKLFSMKGFHHPSGRQAALLTGLAHLYNLIPYQLPSPACGSMWGRSGRRGLAYARLDAQPANPHLGRGSVRCGNAAPLNPVECGTASGLLPISGMSVCRSRNGCRKPAPRPRGRNWGGRPFLRDDETGNWLRGLL